MRWVLLGCVALASCGDDSFVRWDPNVVCAKHRGVASVEHTMAGRFNPISAVCRDGRHITNPEYIHD